MPDSSDSRVAVYLDFDNIVISRYDQVHGRGRFMKDRPKMTATPDAEVAERLTQARIDVGAIIDFAASFGTLVLTRAYADWSAPVNAEYRSQLVARAVDLVQLFPAAAYAKNGADIRLAVDAVEDMFRLEDLTHVVVAAGDSDYVPLAQRCKRLGRYVIGVGVSGSTAKSLAAACDQFDSYEALPGVEKVTPKKTTDTKTTEAESDSGSDKPSRKAAKDPVDDLLRRTLRLEHERTDDDWLHTSVVKSLIKRLDPSFSEKALGHKSFTDFLNAHPQIAELKEDGHIRLVRLVSNGS